MGHNEMLIGRALKGRRDKVLLSVKFGALRGPDGSWLGNDARPIAVKNFLAHSLTRLGVDYIDIYRPARLDPNVPIEDTIGAIADLIRAGYVRAAGLSEVGTETMRRANKVHQICDLQIEYSLISRGPEVQIFPTALELGMGITAYGVLSRGLLSGSTVSGQGDIRANFPRFAGENYGRNRHFVARLSEFAEARRLRPSQVAIAWALAKNPAVVPVIGARTRKHLEEALSALRLQLSPEEVTQLEAAIPASEIAGPRYAEILMKHLDSER
jgi:aryl-alcohol dehydrogenase-like predicted oxidoreductase